MTIRLGPLGAPLAIILVWVAVRVTVLMPASEPPIRIAAKPSSAESVHRSQPPAETASPQPGHQQIVLADYRAAKRLIPVVAAMPASREAGRGREDYVLAASTPIMAETPFEGRSGTVAGYTPPPRAAHRAFTGSGWALVNGTGGAVGVSLLGGSQTGVRLFLQGEQAPIALTARVSRALGAAHDTEVSAGYGFRGKRFGLLVERRERLDVKSGAFVATAYGGVYDVRLPTGLRFDGFAQGGIAGLRQRRWFADGQARVTRRAVSSSQLSVGAGGGAWASAQQGARRVEAGPLVEARIRSGTVGLRVAAEYRFRLMGDARPRSGPAFTIGVDF